MYRWIHETKNRYYQAHLLQDLFGEWTLVRVWGGLGSHQGAVRTTGVSSYADGLAQVQAIGKRRRQHGYLPVVDAYSEENG
ncbi:WGR domain-containing protein [uncultured Thiodictyon sp.]|uniref:WGR domain-containing protein n=1 Tax=uncultured Thiodictyon sp. TaxID=1846217 RepID=UPI0025F13B4C|nr:WGR domain-containing protein [uncultured Thiodictyon sp.]